LSSEPRQASAVSIRRRTRLFCTDRATWEIKLHSTAADGVPSPQIKRGVVKLYQAVTEELLSRESLQTAKTMTGEQQAVRRAE